MNGNSAHAGSAIGPRGGWPQLPSLQGSWPCCLLPYSWSLAHRLPGIPFLRDEGKVRKKKHKVARESVTKMTPAASVIRTHIISNCTPYRRRRYLCIFDPEGEERDAAAYFSTKAGHDRPAHYVLYCTTYLRATLPMYRSVRILVQRYFLGGSFHHGMVKN